MKTLTNILLVAAVAGLTALNVTAENEGGPPGLQKKGGVPPGLQKKGGLPPGQAKKRGADSSDDKSAAAATNSSANATTVKAREPVAPEAPKPTTTEVAKPAPETPKGPIDPQITKSSGQLPKPDEGASKTPDTKPAPRLSREAIEKGDRLKRFVADLDAMGQKSEVRDRLMVRLYKNVGVPISTLQAQEKANPNVGIGGLYIAHAIASRSHKPADSILAEHKAGKDWPTIAYAHKVSLTDLLESAQGAKESAHVAEKEAARR
jgi:hypothetical protein